MPYEAIVFSHIGICKCTAVFLIYVKDSLDDSIDILLALIQRVFVIPVKRITTFFKSLNLRNRAMVVIT